MWLNGFAFGVLTGAGSVALLITFQAFWIDHPGRRWRRPKR